MEYVHVDKKRQYSLESVAYSIYLESILKIAEHGVTLDEGAKVLKDQEISGLEAEDFINQLVANQLLIGDLELSVSGPNNLEQIKSKLLKLKNTDAEINLIDQLRSGLVYLDLKIGNPINKYLNIKALVSDLEIPQELKFMFQTDVFTRFESNKISYRTLKKVKKGIAFLNKVSEPPINQNLVRFKTTFIRRYGNQKIPILHLLDTESGIGYVQNLNNLEATPFLEDLDFMFSIDSAIETKINWTQLQDVILNKLEDELLSNHLEIDLSDTDFSDFEYNWDKSPDIVSSMIEVVLDEEEEKVVINSYWAGGEGLLGRFCYGDEGLMDLTSNIISKEEEHQSSKIFAEIVHFPESRTGNILRRPNLRSYEIPCLGKSNLPIENQIPLDDILVHIE